MSIKNFLIIVLVSVFNLNLSWIELKNMSANAVHERGHCQTGDIVKDFSCKLDEDQRIREKQSEERQLIREQNRTIQEQGAINWELNLKQFHASFPDCSLYKNLAACPRDGKFSLYFDDKEGSEKSFLFQYETEYVYESFFSSFDERNKCHWPSGKWSECPRF